MRKLLIAGLMLTLLPACDVRTSLAAGGGEGLQTQSHGKGAKVGQFGEESFQGAVYKVFVPSSYRAGKAMPLVVMLHGCTQDPDDFAAGTRMNELAEKEGFLVMYPRQEASNHSKKCWRWFDPADQARGAGEPALIQGMIAQVQGRYAVDANAVYAAGMSAGGATTMIMAAAYPELFAAVGVASGLPYKAATSEMNAWMAMMQGSPGAERLAPEIVQAMGANRRAVPLITFQGAMDFTVTKANQDRIVAQWAKVCDLASDGKENGDYTDKPAETTNGQAPGGRRFVRAVYKNAAGAVAMERYLVDGMAHAWSGGNSAGSYTDAAGPDASRLMWEFFKAHPKASNKR